MTAESTPEYDGLDVPALRALLARRDQALADLAATQDELLRAVSHDLRAPLRHITSYGPLVRELIDEATAAGSLTAEASEEALAFLATMDQSARRMGRMLDGLLTLSRAARAPLQPITLDVQALVAEARTALAGAAVGTAVAPGVGTALGARLGETLRRIFGAGGGSSGAAPPGGRTTPAPVYRDPD